MWNKGGKYRNFILQQARRPKRPTLRQIITTHIDITVASNTSKEKRKRLMK